MKTLHLRGVVKMTQSIGFKIQRNAFNKIPRQLPVWKRTSLNDLSRRLEIHSSKFNSSSLDDKFVFCRNCGHKMVWQIPEGDSKQRHICKECGYIDYQNPKMIVGCIAEHDDKILLCKRGIEPCRGRWTLPAGFLELGESSADGAMRETLEEANAEVSIISMFSMIDIPVIGQSYVLFRAKLTEPIFHQPGPETLQTKLFHPTEIPFDQIAFSSIAESLKAYERDLTDGVFSFHHGVISKKPGASPNDPSSFKFHNYIVH